MKLFFKVLAFLSVFALLVSLPTRGRDGTTKTAQAGAITNLAVVKDSSTKSGSATYTITFKNATKIPKDGGRINLRVFGPKSDTSFNSATIATGTTPSSIAVYNRSYDSIVLSTSSDIAANSDITVKLSSVTNPSGGGYYFIHLWTSQYGTNLDGDSNWGSDYKSGYYEIGSNTNVTGTIKDSTGAAMPFAQVYINTTDYKKYHYTYADKDGKYGFGDVAADTYRFSTYQSWNYGTGIVYGQPADTNITVPSSGVLTQNATYQAPTKTITGKITKDTSSGNAVTDANVSIYKSGGSGWGDLKTDSSGNFTFKVPGGTWNFNVYPKTYPADWVYNNSSYGSDQLTFADDTSTDSKTKNFIVKSLSATIKGTLKKPDASVVPRYGASVNFTTSDNYYFYASLDGNEGKFSTKVVPGTYTATGWSSDTSFSFPKIANFSVAENSTYDMGTITLSEKTDTITGTIKDQNGAAVSGVSVSAWKNQDGNDYANTTSASDGSYTIKVTPGTWQVSAYPPWKQDGSDYVYTGKPQSVTVKSGVASTVNFTFQKVTSKIEGLIADSAGTTLNSQNGWASAGDGSQDWGNIGASITNGKFTLKVPKGKWTVSAYLYGGSDYGAPENQVVSIGDSETQSITMKAVKKDATIKGTIYDENGEKITGKYISVYASRGTGASWQSATLDQSQGTYEMKVESGTWKIGWWMDQNLGYSTNNENAEIKVASKDIAIYDIKLKKANATIKGKTTDPNGTPLKWMWVTADTRNPDEKTSSFDKYYNNGASSNDKGEYSIKVPAGTYFVGGNTWYGSGYINPKRQKVSVEENKEATVDLVFRAADAKISGTVTRDGSGVAAYVSASSEDGGSADANTSNEGKYDFSISSGTKWQVIATQQVDKKIYKSERKTVDLTTVTTATQDLALKEQNFTLPDKLTNSFRASDASSIELGDGTKVTIPAGSLLTTNDTVTAQVEPTANLPEQTDAKPATGYGYDITFTKQADQTNVEDFANSITMEYKYDSTKLTGVTDESELHVAYYDKSKSDWVELPNCTTNKDLDTITCPIEHTTVFAIVAAADTNPPAVPTDIKATAGETKVVLSWTKPTDSDFNGVNIYRSTTSGTLGDKVHSLVTDATKEDTGLTNDTTYYYTVRSVDKTGNESTNTAQVSATPSVAAGVTLAAASSASSDGSSSSTSTLPKTGLPAARPAANHAAAVILIISALSLALVGRRSLVK